jgi:hypothetical protein
VNDDPKLLNEPECKVLKQLILKYDGKPGQRGLVAMLMEDSTATVGGSDGNGADAATVIGGQTIVKLTPSLSRLEASACADPEQHLQIVSRSFENVSNSLAESHRYKAHAATRRCRLILSDGEYTIGAHVTTSKVGYAEHSLKLQIGDVISVKKSVVMVVDFLRLKDAPEERQLWLLIQDLDTVQSNCAVESLLDTRKLITLEEIERCWISTGLDPEPTPKRVCMPCGGATTSLSGEAGRAGGSGVPGGLGGPQGLGGPDGPNDPIDPDRDHDPDPDPSDQGWHCDGRYCSRYNVIFNDCISRVVPVPTAEEAAADCYFWTYDGATPLHEQQPDERKLASHKRNVMYWHYATEIYSINGRGNRAPMPPCVLRAVRNKYADSGGEYKDFELYT